MLQQLVLYEVERGKKNSYGCRYTRHLLSYNARTKKDTFGRGRGLFPLFDPHSESISPFVDGNGHMIAGETLYFYSAFPFL